MLDTAFDLIVEFTRNHDYRFSYKWRELLWQFTGFIYDKNFFKAEPTIGEMRQWLPVFADSDDWPFKQATAPK